MYIANTIASAPPPMDPATGTSGAANGTAGAGGANNQLGPDSFLQLLTAQLQNQTPDSSVDPNQMMDELVSFNSLEQLMSINQILQQQFASTAAPSGTAGGAGSIAASGGAASANGAKEPGNA